MPSYPSTYTAYHRSPGTVAPIPPKPRLTISPSNETLPPPDQLPRDEVIVKVHAISLNYRDIGMLIGNYPGFSEFLSGGIPCSDAAGEVVAIGSDVNKFKVGDRVAPITSIGEIEGEEDDDGLHANIGTEVPGVLAQYIVFKEKHLVAIPDTLSWEEVSIANLLSCENLLTDN